MKKQENYVQSLSIAMLGQKTVPARDSSRGGVEVVVEELSKRMVAQGHRVTLYNRAGCDNGDLVKYRGVRLITVPTIQKKGLAAVTSSFMATFKATFGGYDVIHYHAEGACFWMPLTHLFRRRCVATIHGIDWQREKWKGGIGSRYIKLGEKMAVKYADEIIVLSKGVQDYFQNTYNRKTVFIPNGVNRPETKAAKEITEKFGLEKDAYILFLGRIVPEKGLQYLIEAYLHLDTKKKLVIAGGSSDTDEFARELRTISKNNSNIVFTGFVTGRMLEELYSNAYVYVLPSDLEGMPLSLLEAMSYGNCCLVSSIAECTEVVEDKAVIFKQGSIPDLTKKLQMLCDDARMVQRYKDKVAEFICEKYSWDEVSKNTINLYRMH